MSRTSFRVTLHSTVCLNVKELLAQSRRHIWNLSDTNGIRTYNHWVGTRTLNDLAKLAKWLSSAVNAYLYGAFDCVISWVPLLSLTCVYFLKRTKITTFNFLAIKLRLSLRIDNAAVKSLFKNGNSDDFKEVRNSWVTKPSYAKWRHTLSHFECLFIWKNSFSSFSVLCIFYLFCVLISISPLWTIYNIYTITHIDDRCAVICSDITKTI